MPYARDRSPRLPHRRTDVIDKLQNGWPRREGSVGKPPGRRSVPLRRWGFRPPATSHLRPSPAGQPAPPAELNLPTLSASARSRPRAQRPPPSPVRRARPRNHGQGQPHRGPAFSIFAGLALATTSAEPHLCLRATPLRDLDFECWRYLDERIDRGLAASQLDKPPRHERDVGRREALDLGDLVGPDVVHREAALGALVDVEEQVARLRTPKRVRLREPLVAVVSNANAEAVAGGEARGLETTLSGAERQVRREVLPRGFLSTLTPSRGNVMPQRSSTHAEIRSSACATSTAESDSPVGTVK